MKTNIKNILEKQGYFIYSFEGTSMLPLLVMGEDKVHIKKENEYKLFDVVLFEVRKGYYILHRIIAEKDGEFAIVGDNSRRVDFVKKEKIVGKMVGFYKKDKYFDLNSDLYTSYMENYVFNSDEDRKQLVEDSNKFFKSRLENAFYQLLKLMFNKQVDEKAFTVLTPFEKENFYDFAYRRKASHLVGLLIEKYGIEFSDNTKKDALNQLNRAKMRFAIIENAINELTNEFNKEKIPHIFLKGSELRNKYPAPYLRVSNDIDLLVKNEDFERAQKVLIDKLGGKFYATTPHDSSYVCEKIKMDVELHHAINTDLPVDLAYLNEDPFEDAVRDNNDSYRYHLSKEKECVFHLAHFAKHLNGGDYWITMFSDTILLKEEIEEVKATIKEARLEKFYDTISELFGKAFNNAKLSKETEEFEGFIFRSVQEINTSLQKGKYKTKFSYIMMRIFPPYRYFYGTSKALQKFPILLPFFWIKRWFKAIFIKGHLIKKSKQEMKEYNQESIHSIEILFNAGLSDYIVKPEDTETRF